MQDLKIDELLNNVTKDAANVCGGLTTIRISFNELKKEIEELKKERDKHIIDRNATIMQLEKQVKYLEKELNETCKTKELDLENHNKRDMALVDELAKKNDEIKQLKEETEKLKVDLIHEREKNEKLAKAHAELENDTRKYATDIISQSKTICNLEKELEKTRTCKNVEVGMLKEENDNLKAQNERLKTEVTEALAKRDYYQDLANKEAADAKKAKWNCKKEMEWQKKKLQEFDYVLTKYRAKIKELEDANGFSELVINLIMKG